MSEDTISRIEVLLSMPEMDRLNALGDELYYGQFWAEKTDGGWRRLDPVEQTETAKQ